MYFSFGMYLKKIRYDHAGDILFVIPYGPLFKLPCAHAQGLANLKAIINQFYTELTNLVRLAADLESS